MTNDHRLLQLRHQRDLLRGPEFRRSVQSRRDILSVIVPLLNFNDVYYSNVVPIADVLGRPGFSSNFYDHAFAQIDSIVSQAISELERGLTRSLPPTPDSEALSRAEKTETSHLTSERVASDDKDTLVDRWLRAIKNQKIIAALIVLGITVGAVATFTDSISKLIKFWRDSREASSIASFSQLKPDYSKHTKLWYPLLLYPELRSKLEALRKLASGEGINLQYYETYRPPEVQHQMYAGTPRVTGVDAWSSPKQYGLAATLWIYDSSGWAENPHEQVADRLALLATTVGLRQEGDTGIFVPWTYMLPSTKVSDLKAGRYPPRTTGDDRWADNINEQIASWGERNPPAPPRVPARK